MSMDKTLVTIYGDDAGTKRLVKVNSSGYLEVSVVSSSTISAHGSYPHGSALPLSTINPLIIGGHDYSGVFSTLKVDTTGRIRSVIETGTSVIGKVVITDSTGVADAVIATDFGVAPYAVAVAPAGDSTSGFQGQIKSDAEGRAHVRLYGGVSDDELFVTVAVNDTAGNAGALVIGVDENDDYRNFVFDSSTNALLVKTQTTVQCSLYDPLTTRTATIRKVTDVAASDYGLIPLGTDGSNYTSFLTDSSGRLQVRLFDSGGDGLEFYSTSEGVASPKGILLLGYNTSGARLYSIETDASGQIMIGGVIPGVGSSNLGKAEDSVHSTGDVGVMALGIRSNSASAKAADGDYHTFQVDGVGKLWVTGTYNEDGASASGDSGIVALAVRRDTPVDNANVSADGDYTNLLTDKGGLLRETRSHYYTKQMTGTETGASQVVPARNWSLQVVTGTATTWTVLVEGSNDNANWDTMLTHTNATPGDKNNIDMAVTGIKIRRYWRVRVSAISNVAHTLTVYCTSMED